MLYKIEETKDIDTDTLWDDTIYTTKLKGYRESILYGIPSVEIMSKTRRVRVNGYDKTIDSDETTRSQTTLITRQEIEEFGRTWYLIRKGGAHV